MQVVTYLPDSVTHYIRRAVVSFQIEIENVIPFLEYYKEYCCQRLHTNYTKSGCNKIWSFEEELQEVLAYKNSLHITHYFKPDRRIKNALKVLVFWTNSFSSLLCSDPLPPLSRRLRFLI